MNLKVAIVGCGSIADGHVEEVGKIGGAEVVAACDREILMAEQLADRYRIPGVYDDFERMLSEARPHVVHITTPPQSHADLAHRAMDAGCHVYVEKPVAPDAATTAAIVEQSRRLGRQLTAGHIYQFDPPALEVRRMIERGVLGEVTHVESHFGYNLDGNFGRAIMGSSGHWVHGLPGGLIHNNISHPLARAVEFIPADDPEVKATALRRSPVHYGDHRDDVYDEMRILLAGGGVTASVTFTASARPVSHRARIYGTRNTAEMNLVTRTVTLERSPSLPSALGRVFPAFSQGWEYHRQGWKNLYRFARYRYHFMAGMNELLRRFYESIRTGGDPPIPYREIETIARIIDIALEQTRPGGHA